MMLHSVPSTNAKIRPPSDRVIRWEVFLFEWHLLPNMQVVIIDPVPRLWCGEAVIVDMEKVVVAFKFKHDQAAYAKRHYEANKHAYKQRAKRHNKEVRIRLRAFVFKYLSEHQCVDCGEDDPIVLDFDHVSGVKLNNIADIKSKGLSMRQLKAEIDKCEVRCANCHRRMTHKRRLERRAEATTKKRTAETTVQQPKLFDC